MWEPFLGQAWWYTSLIPTLHSRADADGSLWGQPGLHSETLSKNTAFLWWRRQVLGNREWQSLPTYKESKWIEKKFYSRKYWCVWSLGNAIFVFCRDHLQPLRCSMIGLVSGQDLSSAMMANSYSFLPMAASSVLLMHSRVWWCTHLGWADSFEVWLFPCS